MFGFCTMDSKQDFDVFVGGKSGIFKGVKIGKKECVTKNIKSLISITNNDEVTTMSWADDEEKEILIGCGAKQVRSVKVYDTETCTFTSSFFCNVGEGSINGISQYDGAILTAVHSGEINLWRFQEEDKTILNAGEKLNRMQHSKVNKNIIATGGQEHKLKLFDLETQKQTFIEKNLPHDWLQLRVPIWISDIGFFPGTEQVAIAGRYGHVRLYDPKAQRRPVIKLEVKDEALTTLAVTPREKQIIVGSGKGRMNLVDLRKPGKILNTYKGFVGGVTGIACSAKEPCIVSVSLDRHLRVHHFDTKQLLKKVYLTSRLSCLSLRSEFSLSTESESSQECVEIDNTDKNENLEKENMDNDVEYDELFENMQVVSNKEDKKLINKKRKKEELCSLTENGDDHCKPISKKGKTKKQSQRS